MWMDHDLRGSSIVAADDDPANLQVLDAMLRELGCEVRLTRDGGMLLQSVAMKLPDLILLDVHMPGIDGYETCKRLKADVRTKDIPVIFISAMNEEFSKLKGFELGAVDYITKPFQLEELKARIGVHMKLAQQARELRNLQAAVEQSRTSILITDLDGTIEYANQACSEVTGYAMAEIIGHNPRMFKSDVHPAAFYTELWATISRGEVWRGELCNCKKDGSLYWELVVISPVRGPDGSFTCYVAVKEDITEQRQLREQLIAAKEQAEAANRAKSTFLAMMSHEIRTPMNGVIGMIDLLNQTELDGEQRRLTRVAKVSSMSLLNIINDVLDFSKIEAGRMQLESIPVAWRGLIDSVAEIVASSLLNKHLRLYCLVDPAVPGRVCGDLARLRQILLNLLSNAIKFTETSAEKQGEILVRLYSDESAEEPQLVLEVEDNGIGISQSQLEHLFTPFEQADNSTHRRFGGTGLGLSICRRLVSLMQGEISCVSEEGLGAKFVVTLPCTTANSAEKKAPLLQGCRVLLVSNNLRMQEYLTRDLRRLGAEVLVADEAALADGNRYRQAEVLLLAGDWESGEINRRVQAYRQAYPHGRCVLVTPLSEAGEYSDIAECERVAANPFRPEAIYQALGIVTGRESREVKPKAVPAGHARPTPTPEQAEAAGTLILVAEDNPVNQEVIQRQLNLLGYAADVAEDGEVALQKMQQRSYGLLLTDCHMPNMDGFELTAAVRKQESRSTEHMPIVAITANAMQGEAQRCLLAGMDGYLAKPVELTRLQAALEQWLPMTPELATADQTADESPAESDAEVIDQQLLCRFLGNDPQIHHTFMRKFVDDSQAIITSVQAAVAEGDWPVVAAQMHKLKSSSKAIGAVTLSDLCVELEQAAKAEEAERAGVFATAVSEAFARVCDYVSKLPE